MPTSTRDAQAKPLRLANQHQGTEDSASAA
jgi:hypothetical protein